MPTVVITGANGFIGSYLVSFFTNKGWKVKALVHNMPQQSLTGVEYHLHNLLSAPDEKVFQDVDYFIHCAYAKGDFELNVTGTKQLLEMSRKCGVKKNIFISSISSIENALSVYGKQKWACEKLLEVSKDLIIRPGLVLGDGGLFGQMREYLKTKQTIPLISGGTQPMQTVFINDLAECIFTCMDKNLRGVFTIASEEKTLYKEFYTLLCSTLNTKPKFVSVPYGLFYFMLSISESIGIKLPVSRENLLGLKQLKYVDTTEDLKKIGITLKNARESLQALSL
jgi:nucleoside-diphosphate-sugar epimerase